MFDESFAQIFCHTPERHKGLRLESYLKFKHSVNIFKTVFHKAFTIPRRANIILPFVHGLM